MVLTVYYSTDTEDFWISVKNETNLHEIHNNRDGRGGRIYASSYPCVDVRVWNPWLLRCVRMPDDIPRWTVK